MEDLYIFIDGSVNTKTKVGYGAVLILKDMETTIENGDALVKVKRFEHTSSTKLELQTLLWVLNELKNTKHKITLHTDSQNILSLLTRRKRLEDNNYFTKKGELINNHLLYKEFYSLLDIHTIEILKIKGHQASSQKTPTDKIFTLVDRASRKALRDEYA